MISESRGDTSLLRSIFRRAHEQETLEKLKTTMGNACRRLVDCCSEPSSLDGQLQAGDHQFRLQQNGGTLCPAGSTASSHGVTVHTAGFAALARDLFQFEITSQVLPTDHRLLN